jgi:hypothetical protein
MDFDLRAVEIVDEQMGVPASHSDGVIPGEVQEVLYR